MSLELTSLVFLDGAPDCIGPWRIKVEGEGAVVLSFASAEAAMYFAHLKGINPVLVGATQLPDGIFDERLLVFESIQAIDEAYRDQVKHDFSRLLRPWPRKSHAT